MPDNEFFNQYSNKNANANNIPSHMSTRQMTFKANECNIHVQTFASQIFISMLDGMLAFDKIVSVTIESRACV